MLISIWKCGILEREPKKSLIKFAVGRVTLSSVLAPRKMDVASLNGLLIHSLVP